MRPKNYNKPRFRSFNVRLPLELFERLAKEALESHLSVADLIVRRLDGTLAGDQDSETQGGTGKGMGRGGELPCPDSIQPEVDQCIPEGAGHASDLPPMGESGEVPQAMSVEVSYEIRPLSCFGLEPDLLTSEEFYALSLPEQMKAVREGKF